MNRLAKFCRRRLLSPTDRNKPLQSATGVASYNHADPTTCFCAAPESGSQDLPPIPHSTFHESRQGEPGRRYGCCSEWATLREVLLSWPGERLALNGPPEDYLMLAQPDLAQMRRQTEQIASFYERQGIRVHLCDAPQAPPNFVFQRDLFLMTPAGAVLARPALPPRAGEERYAAEALGRLGVPVLMRLAGRATFEGADALWLDPQTVLLGTGQRTNAAARGQLEPLLLRLGVEVYEISMPGGTQHLLGIVNFVDRDLAAVRSDKAPARLRQILRERGVSVLELPPSKELLRGRAMNFVTLSPRVVVMPAGCPETRASYCRAGIEVYELDVSEYLKAAGGLGCLTGIVRREEG